MQRAYIYKRYLITQCESVEQGSHTPHKGKWIVQPYYSIDLPWADEECVHFPSLAAAREFIHQWQIAS